MRREYLVYISGPITPKYGYTAEQNMADGVKLFFTLIRLGIPAFCPQMCGAFPSAWNGDITWQNWMDYDYAVIDRCTHLLMMDRWQQSTGAMLEKEYAESRGIPVFMSLDELLATLT